MTGDTPDAASAPEPAPPSPPPPPPERYPFWGYADLLLFAGLTVPCMLLGWAIVKAAFAVLRVHTGLAVMELLPEQFLGCAFLFGSLALILRLEYDRPFWRSLEWTSTRMPFLWIVICGLVCAIVVAMLGSLIRTPNTGNPLTDLMQDRTSAILMAVFGVTIAPLTEELAFRGFLQPLLVRSLGAAPGICLAALPFGLLHFHEYGNSWRHAVLIALAGACFGWMRQATGSTRASAIMHAAYNGFIFAVVFMQGRNLPHS